MDSRAVPQCVWQRSGRKRQTVARHVQVVLAEFPPSALLVGQAHEPAFNSTTSTPVRLGYRRGRSNRFAITS
jgi:hypothetical protein